MLFLSENAVVDQDSTIAKELDVMLEDAGIEKGTYDVFDGDEAGALEICLEMETAWHALETQMMGVEHQSIVSESVEILNEGVKEFFKKVGDIFKKMWDSISGFFKKLWENITSFFSNAEKWWVKNEKEITAEKAKATVYAKVANGTMLDHIKSEVAAWSKSSTFKTDKETVEQIEESVKQFKETSDKAFETFKAPFEKAEEVEVTKKAVADTLVGSNKKLEVIKQLHAAETQNIKNVIGIAKAGEIASGDDEVKALKAKVGLAKVYLSYQKKVQAAAVKFSKKSVSQALTAGKALMRESNKKEDKKD